MAMCPHFLEENEILLHVGQCLKDKVQIPKKEKHPRDIVDLDYSDPPHDNIKRFSKF